MKDNKKSVVEKVKTIGVKKVSRGVVIIFFLFTLVFATITQLGFQSFNVGKWASNSLIMCGILVFGLVMGESGGQDYYRGLPNGTYQHNVREYNDFNASIKPIINNFDEWFSEMLPDELEKKKVNFLVKNGIKLQVAKNIVKYCKVSDYFSLVNNDATKVKDENGNDIYLPKIEEYQKDAVLWVLEGKIKLDTPNACYFTTLYNDELQDITILEQGKAITRKKKKVKNTNRAVRITSSIVISLVVSTLTVYELMQGNSVDAWMNLVSRITGLFTSILSGYMGSKVVVNLEARAIKNKYEVIYRYKNAVDSGEYKIKNEQELLKAKFEKQKEKEKDNAKNVITPEIVGVEQKNFIPSKI